jgi:hypothetical protein
MTWSLDDARSATKRLLKSDRTSSFVELCRVSGLNPATDFRWADLRGVDLSNELLAGFDFRGADLRNANLHGAQFQPQQLEGADITGALIDRPVATPPFSRCFSTEDGWETVDKEARAKVFAEINPLLEGVECTLESSEVHSRPLYWYRNSILLRIRDARWSPSTLRIYCLSNGSTLHLLDGTSAPIHGFNEKVPIRLREQDTLDYLRFFCFFVRGEGGAFYIVESADDPMLSSQTGAASVLERVATPAIVTERGDDGRAICKAIVLYDRALFRAEFAVDSNGMMEMLDDEPIEGDLPFRIEAPIRVHASS